MHPKLNGGDRVSTSGVPSGFPRTTDYTIMRVSKRDPFSRNPTKKGTTFPVTARQSAVCDLSAELLRAQLRH